MTYGAVTMCSNGYIIFTNAFAATSFSDLTKVIVGENSTVTIEGDLEFSGAEAEYIVNYVADGGRFVVTGDIKVMPGKTGTAYPCFNYNAHKGVIAAKGLVNNSTSGRANRFALTRGYANTQVNWEVGEHGISGTDGFWKPLESTVQSTITAEVDFRISSEIATQGPLTLATTGTDGQEHTIEIIGDTARRGICGSSVNYSAGFSGSVTITGAGRVVADYNVNNLTSKATEKANAFNVLGTATFALKPGSNIGTGRVTVTNAATLAVCESGTVTLNGSLALADGASLGFNFTNIRTPPVLACANAPTFIEGEATNITVKVSGDVRPSKGEKVLTTCGGFDADGVTVTLSADAPNWVAGFSVNGDGNLVLAVKPKGLMLIVK